MAMFGNLKSISIRLTILPLLMFMAFAATADELGDPAPEFTLNDASGVEYELDTLKGQVVMINFWASWCAP
ncbi:MAG: TlpA family protein disulfide reductase, partial [Gammaproteobacteria bacterium]